MTESTLPPDDLALDEAAVEALLTGSSGVADPIADVLDALRVEGRRPAPEPSAALSELLATGLAGDALARRRNRSRIVVGMLLAGGTTLGLSGVAAAHDALPAPAQSVVTDIVNGFTPFHIPDDGSPVPTPTDIAPHPRTAEPGDAGDRPAGRAGDERGRSGRDGGGPSGPDNGGSGRSSSSGDSGPGGGSGSGGGSASTDSGSGGSGPGGRGSGDSGSGRSSGSGDSGSGGGSDSGSGGSGSGGSGSG